MSKWSNPGLHIHLDCSEGGCFDPLFESFVSVFRDIKDSDSNDLVLCFSAFIESQKCLSDFVIIQNGEMRLLERFCVQEPEMLLEALEGSSFKSDSTIVSVRLLIRRVLDGGGLKERKHTDHREIVLKTMIIAWILRELNVSLISIAPLPCNPANQEHVGLLKGLPVVLQDESESNDTRGLLLVRALYLEVLDSVPVCDDGRLPTMTLAANASCCVDGVTTSMLVGYVPKMKNNEKSNDTNDWNVQRMLVLEANIDDMTAERLGFLCDRLLDKGAADAWTSPIGMKKSRPGTLVSCLVHDDQLEDMLKCVFVHSTTLGIRVRPVDRYALRRQVTTVNTIWTNNPRQGRVDVKCGYLNGQLLTQKAEFDHVRTIALAEDESMERIASDAVSLALAET